MTREAIKTEANNLVVHGKNIVAEGNQRQLVFRNKAGETFFESSLTVVAVVSLVLLATGFISIPLVVIASGIAMLMGIRVNVQRHNETVELEA